MSMFNITIIIIIIIVIIIITIFVIIVVGTVVVDVVVVKLTSFVPYVLKRTTNRRSEVDIERVHMLSIHVIPEAHPAAV